MTNEANFILKCANCGKVYTLVLDSMVSMLEQAIAEFMIQGSPIIRFNPAPDEQPTEDLVMYLGPVENSSDTNARSTALKFLLASLYSGKRRKWRCGSCGHIQEYPSSFYAIKL